MASAVGSTPTQYDPGESQCNVCEDRLQDSCQRVEDLSVAVHISPAFNIIATRAHPIIICLVQVRHRGLATAAATTAPNAAELAAIPSTRQISKHTDQQVTACDSCVRFWVSKVLCSSTQTIKRQHSRCNPLEQRSCSESPSCALVSHRSPGSPPGPGSVVVPSVPMYLPAVGATCTSTPASSHSIIHG